MKQLITTAVLVLLVASAIMLLRLLPDSAMATGDDEHSEEPELAALMMRLNYFNQKLGYAIDANNEPLTSLYLDEVEETVADIIRDVPIYDGHPVSQLTESLALPSLEALEMAFENRKGDWQPVRDGYRKLVDSCNGCHVSTAHAYIKIVASPTEKPFAQDFSPQ